MDGFIKFEAKYLLPGWFDLNSSDDDVWYSASLTELGYENSKLGLIPYNHDIGYLKDYPFFLPPVNGTIELLPCPETKIDPSQLLTHKDAK
jgi:hypothetical protein